MILLIRCCLLFRVIFHLLVARINFALLRRRCIRAAFVMRIRVIRDLVPTTRTNVVTIVSRVCCRFVDGTAIQKVRRGGRWRRRQRGR